MGHLRRKLILSLCTLTGILTLSLSFSTALAAGQPVTAGGPQVAIANADEARNCHHVEVRLNNMSATLTCVDRLMATAPYGPGSDNGCTNPAHNIIHLYADTNETGDSLCIYGNSTGWLNLNTIPHGWWGIYGS